MRNFGGAFGGGCVGEEKCQPPLAAEQLSSGSGDLDFTSLKVDYF